MAALPVSVLDFSLADAVFPSCGGASFHHVSVFVEVEVKVHGEKLWRVSLKCFEATKIGRDSVSYLGRDGCE